MAALVGAGIAQANKPSYGCPPGFNLGAYTFEEYMQLPRTVAAINAGLIDAETVLAGLAARFDHNANEVVCVQLSHGFETNSRPFGEFFYNVADDTRVGAVATHSGRASDWRGAAPTAWSQRREPASGAPATGGEPERAGAGVLGSWVPDSGTESADATHAADHQHGD